MFPILLSVVVVLRNRAEQVEPFVAVLGPILADLVEDHEIIVVDNASTDHSLAELSRLTSEDGLENLQVYALTSEVDADAAAWAGVENALGDFVAVLDPSVDDARFLATMLASAVGGTDVVFATNSSVPPQSLAYRALCRVVDGLLRSLCGPTMPLDAPQYRVLSKGFIAHLLRHPSPISAYRYLPNTGAVHRAHLRYSAPAPFPQRKSVRDAVDRGLQLLVASTRAPMRLVTTLSLFGAGANVLYSLYVVAIGLLKADVEPGWVTLSLQQSGMFVLISLVLLVLGEYLVNMARISSEGPAYQIGREFASARQLQKRKLNVTS